MGVIVLLYRSRAAVLALCLSCGAVLLWAQGSNGGERRTHTVARKETLYGIATQYGLSVNQLLEANPDVKADQPLRLGQVLRIPAAVVLPEFPDAVESVGAAPAASASSGLPVHQVAAGETLYALARKYGCTVIEIQAANPGLTSDLRIGSTLVLPATAYVKTGSTTVASPASAQPTAPAVGSPKPSPTSSPAADVSWRPDLPCLGDDTLHILAILPFCAEIDSLPGGGYPPKVERMRMVAQELYAGAEWAAVEWAQSGRPVVLKAVDSEATEPGRRWKSEDMRKADVILGPLQRSAMDSALQISESLQRPHWLLTPQPRTSVAAARNALLGEPSREDALEHMGQELARRHAGERIWLLRVGGEEAAAEAAFLRGFRAAAAAASVAGSPRPRLDTIAVTSRFATGVTDRMTAGTSHVLVIPAGSSTRAMVAHLQTALRLVKDRDVRIYISPDAEDYEFLERGFLERTRLTMPRKDWMDWDHPEVWERVRWYREEVGVEPGPLALLAHDAVLETAGWCLPAGESAPGPISRKFDWESTGPETGAANRGWHLVTFCNLGWRPESACAEAPSPEEKPR